MGEWSKSIGEKGEEIVKFIFEEILQFNSLVENTSINCIKGEKHKSDGAIKDRSTHGIDGLLYTESQVEDGLLDIMLISSKYTMKYPQNPKSLFKSHIKDLAFSIECFKNSKENSEINQKFNTIEKTDLTGILVWLSNEDAADFDLSSKVNNTILENDLIFDKIVLLDNNRVNFLFQSIYVVKQKYGEDKVDFVYHRSGLNEDSLQALTYGNKFPVNYLYSDIISLRVVKGNEILLVLHINEDFSKENFSRILSFAKSFDHLNSIERTIINFKTYDKLTDEKDVKDVLSSFSNFSLNKNLSVKKYPMDYKNQ